jgi:HK97 family phage portal protein
MSIIDNLRKFIDGIRDLPREKAAQIQYPDWLMQTAGVQQYSMPDLSMYGSQADLYRRLSWVQAAVTHVANAVSLVDFNIYNLSGDDKNEIDNHPFEQLLRHPNPLDSRHEFLGATVAMKKLTGNAYWWLNRTSEKAPPDELWMIPSHMIIPVPDKNMYLKGYYYYPGDGQEMLLEPWEICQFRSFNPFNRFVGLSAIESLAQVAMGDLGMQAWNTKFFKDNNARLPGILTFEAMVADDQWAKIKEDTREASKKRELMMLRGVGAGGINWMQNSVSQKANKEQGRNLDCAGPRSFVVSFGEFH